MKNSLKSKFILSYMAVALITILIVVVGIRFSSDQSLRNMVVDQQVAEVSDIITEYYQAYDTLDGFALYYMRNTNPSRPNDNGQGQGMRMNQLRGLLAVVDTDYRTIFPGKSTPIGAILPESRRKDAEPVKVDGEIVAWIIREPNLNIELNAEEQRFIRRTNLAVGAAAGIGMLTAIAVGILLTGRLIKPIQDLTQASTDLAQGALGKRVEVSSRDELGQLAESFNQMSSDLAKADQQRKRLTADISHDLSTPLQIISGYMEMLADGQAELTPQQIGIIKTEIEHLRRLVRDLSLLSQAEGGGLDIQLAPVNPKQLLETVYQAYLPIAVQQGVDLRLEIDPQDCYVAVDEGRMVQVLQNLVENALRHTPAGGSVELSSHIGTQVELRVSDTGTGIPAEDLPFVFERFYQADKARSARQGKLGLGLAICKALTEAQGCRISAQSDGKDQGTRVSISITRY